RYPGLRVRQPPGRGGAARRRRLHAGAALIGPARGAGRLYKRKDEVETLANAECRMMNAEWRTQSGECRIDCGAGTCRTDSAFCIRHSALGWGWRGGVPCDNFHKLTT